jgi:lysophosphatidic acid phosphatase type 6
MYSCHDTSLIPLLVSLGCFDNKWPNYAADIVFELYEDKAKNHWVKVLYEGNVSAL